jgi:hypothetical protein
MPTTANKQKIGVYFLRSLIENKMKTVVVAIKARLAPLE